MKHMNLRCKAFMVLLIVLFTVSVLCGCARVFPSAKAASDPVPKLQLAITLGSGQVLTPEDLENNYDGNITYVGLNTVDIQLGDKNLPLADAIKNGEVTVEELIAWARIDARYDLCTETFESKNGLAQFYYTYPEFQLGLIYDVYETPDGESHLIKQFSVRALNQDPSTPAFPKADGTGFLDDEDWGLTFEVPEATSTSVKVKCTQKDGQQVGTLHVQDYILYSTTEEGKIYFDKEKTAQGIPLNMDGTTDFSIDWKDAFGELPKGDYAIRLTLEDVYDPADIHPLIRKYHDQQFYEVKFSVK